MNLIEKLVDKINTKHSSTANFYAFDPVGHSKFYLSALEWVLTQIDALKNEHNNGWISVDDDLPNPEQEINFLDSRFEPSRFYLIQLKDGFINTAYYATICDDCEYKDIFISCTVKAKDNRYYAQECGFDTYTVYEVSRWQPLPSPPKE